MSIKLPDYNIIRKIGSGGMGDVYIAKHKVLENTVAVKSLHNNLVNDENIYKIDLYTKSFYEFKKQYYFE